jgi:hypothetical protein
VASNLVGWADGQWLACVGDERLLVQAVHLQIAVLRAAEPVHYFLR